MKEIAEFVKKRNASLASLDMDWAREQMPDTADEIRIMAMHKARYECTGISDELRHESKIWLQDKGHYRLIGDFLPDGEFPRQVTFNVECDGCGDMIDEAYTKECPYCGKTKCVKCDMGDDVECPNCDID